MDTRSDQFYWLKKNGIKQEYPPLTADTDVHVAIIGAGLTAALTAYYLYRDDVKVAILDQYRAGMGSTAATSASLQYEQDTPLHLLAEKVGRLDAVHAYKLTRKAISDLHQICKKLRTDVGFTLCPSLQYTADPKNRHMLYREYGFRLTNGFDVNWIEPDEAKRAFGIRVQGAILSEEGAVVDPYLLTHRLLEYVRQKNFSIYEHTGVADIRHEDGLVMITTNTGHRVRAKKVFFAAGYESLPFLPRNVVDLYSTFTVISDPLPAEALWYRKATIREAAKPAMHFRVTDDNRIMISGRDDAFLNVATRDARTKKKSEQLLHYFSQNFPDIPIKADHAWGHTYTATPDGLPYIGSIPGVPNSFFAVGLGANHVPYSVVAAQMIRDMIKGRTPTDSHIFSFTR